MAGPVTLNQRVWSSSLQRPTRESPAKSRTFCGSPLPLSKRQFRGCRRHVDCLHVKMAMNSLVYVKLRDCRARCRKRDCEDLGSRLAACRKLLDQSHQSRGPGCHRRGLYGRRDDHFSDALGESRGILGAQIAGRWNRLDRRRSRLNLLPRHED